MIGTIPAKTMRTARLGLAVAGLVGVMAVGASAASASQEVIYNTIPSPKPGNVVSLGFEATATSSFGGQVEFAGSARKNPNISVLMSSWACQSGTWNGKDCVSAYGSKYELPITVSLYEVGPENSVGALVGSETKLAKVPYRPSANNKKCTGENAGAWYHMGECFNGKAFKLAVTLKKVTAPAKAIVTVAFNTSDYGAAPQRPQPCNSEPQGCPYDSLNVGVQDGFANPGGTPPTVGAFPAPDVAYVDGSSEAEWTGFQPLFEVKAR